MPHTTVLETVVRPLETVAALQRFENRRPNQGSRVGQQHIVRRRQEMRQESVGSALSLVDPMELTAKIVSLIDTVRYINWRRRLILVYIVFVGGFPGIAWHLLRPANLHRRCGCIAVPASCQTHSESQQNDREYEQSDSAKAIIAVPKVNDEHHDHADDWQQD